MKGRKKHNTIILLALLILGISIGYSLLSTTLKINGTANLGINSWDVYWDNLDDVSKSSSVTTVIPAAVDTDDPTQIDFSVILDKPGDFYEFEVDAVNNGTIDAMVDTISTVINDNPDTTLPSYIKYSVTYNDGREVKKGHLLRKATNNTPTTKRYKIRLEFSRDISNEDYVSIPSTGLDYKITVSIPYVQADEKAVEPYFFATATWDEIVEAYNDGEPTPALVSSFEQGETKPVELTSGLQANLRIANLSKPEECEDTNYSQTACGLVIEFADIVTTHRMNYYDRSSWAHGNGEGTWGGWEYSDMRAFLNGYTYSRESINYASTGFINTLPNDLRNKIIDTKISYGSNHGGSKYTRFVTDKLYLFSPTEIFGKETGDPQLDYDMNINKTRQLDYYADRMDTLGYNEYGVFLGAAAKNTLDPEHQTWSPENTHTSFWALREANGNNNYDSSFYNILYQGSISWTYSSFYHGVSPAFRLAD